MDRYRSYTELERCEIEGQDYRIRVSRRASGIVVMAPHGGGIEPGTSEIAEATAGIRHSFYTFEGLKRHGCRDLHITSINFNEPKAMEMALASEVVMAIHGCRGEDSVTYLGGTDDLLKGLVREALEEAGFPVMENPRFPGLSPCNICNRSRCGKGVQLEISRHLRETMFRSLSQRKEERSPVFHAFSEALRRALSRYEVFLPERRALDALLSPGHALDSGGMA